ncbi:hypothetical protein JYU34_015799 [Plutella xylostella]|uniref:Uncharacterized protein n=1 Tax=Plutella xylostella TaxID=51655 RepID=A0ABQ7Q4S4_PLUXY|nr:hypothetical protein JYU34_015799 [Plutella xylostella]
MSSVQEEKSPTEGPKTRIHELRNAELVSRLLAATPPYLYSALPLQPHAFFFSEMLRSFVNARHGCRPPHHHRRFKRRSHKYFAENDDNWQRRAEWPKPEEDKKDPEPIRPEVPLELTVDKHTKIRDPSPTRLSPSPKTEDTKPSSPGRPERRSSFVDVGTEDLAKPLPSVGRSPVEAAPPSNLILPPPPPMWYPPIYNPQFGVDPLNFFIDLRVSGHIYDRKRAAAEGLDTGVSAEVKTDDIPSVGKTLGRDFGQRPRHVSAFSVPVRSSNISVDAPAKYFDHSLPERSPMSGKVNGTSYVMRNLKRVYEHLQSAQNVKEDKTEREDDTKEDSSDVIDDDIME